MTARRALAGTVIGLTVTVIGLLLVLPADATSLPIGCKAYANHPGTVPGEYDYAVFQENELDQLPGQYEFTFQVTNPNPGSSFYLDPQTAFKGNQSWDQVLKCKNQSSTTSTSEATTTTVPDSTTTEPSTTSTTIESTTTSTPDSTTSSTPSSSTSLPEATTSLPDGSTSTLSDSSTSTGPEQLPYTGADTALLLVAGIALVTVGGLFVKGTRDDS